MTEQLSSADIRKRFLDFFEKRGHTVLPSASLVPEGDPSVLFTTAGMQQFKPYYTGAKDAQEDLGTKNVVTVQKCVRTGDIDEVGDDTHLTFFEMLGNFSFGGYGKEDAIKYAYDFITKELQLEIDFVTVFKDDLNLIPPDEESKSIWKLIDPGLKVVEQGRADNFWGPTGDEGPCGPTTEIYINGVEVWNIVFNEYYKSKEGKYTPLEVKGVDTGMGLERLLVQVQKVKNVYETDLFEPVINEIKKIANRNLFIENIYDEKSARIVADHLRTSIFLISDGVLPDNKDQGYILRRLLRRAIRYADKLGLSQGISSSNSDLSYLTRIIIDIYIPSPYSIELGGKANFIFDEIEKEEKKFRKTLKEGLKQLENIAYKIENETLTDPIKRKHLDGLTAFNLYQTYGFPIELTIEICNEKGITVDLEDFNKRLKDHQELSRLGAEQKFKGGLANTNEQTTKLHTAHHLLLAALQKVVSSDIHQKGSNITDERLRLDFNFDRKLTDEEKKSIEDLVNSWIAADYPVEGKEMPREEAEKLGAEMEFGAKYPDMVNVYVIEDKDGNHISKEFCGGPHVTHTGALGHFSIQKEEASSAGVRRIKATLG